MSKLNLTKLFLQNTQNFQVMGGQKVMQKVQNTSNGQQQGQCVQVSQAMLGTQPTAQIISPIQPNGQPMQFAPWQFSNAIPQVAWTTGGLQSQALLAPNPIFIRGTQPDGTPGGMFIQHNPQATTTIQAQHQRKYLHAFLLFIKNKEYKCCALCMYLMTVFIFLLQSL